MSRSACASMVVGLICIGFSSCSCGPPPTNRPEGSPCDNAQQCAAGLVCDPGTARCHPVTCERDGECGVGAICEGGACVPNVSGGRCNDDAACVSPETCFNGTCSVEGGDGRPCASADDCAGGRVCAPDTDTCASDLACTVPADCGLAANCDGGVCVPGCVGIGCDQVVCQGGGTTSISGVVNIPAGTLPLPNVLVFVPTQPLDVITSGASCYRCDADITGAPLVLATTNTRGEFTLDDVPAGEDIPLVIQVGKWRRQITIPAVPECVDTPIDPVLTRLPRDRSEGDIPQIALTTGGADSLECLMRKLGIADSEFSTEDGTGAVHFYVGRNGSSRFADGFNDGAQFTPARDWWNTLDALTPYDILVMSCEGDQDGANKSAEARQALEDYTYLGGRVFLSHWHNIWIEGGPTDMRSVATWDFRNDPASPALGTIDMSHDKGAQLAEWMLEVGGSTTLGEMSINEPQRTLATIDLSRAQKWVSIEPEPGTELVQYFSFNTPVGAPDDELCGRVVYSDIHVAAGDSEGADFPSGCTTTELSAQEKALVFLMFDLSSCITPDETDCEPTSCEALGLDCGEAPNGCGGILNCGVCPGTPCDDLCVNECGSFACLLPEGECGACRGNGDCCPGSLCLDSGECVPIGG